MINKLLQFHWIWDAWPSFADSVIGRWRDMNPGWDTIVIREIPGNFPTHLKYFTDESSIHPAHRADLFRAWAMKEYGGVYVDIDTLPIRPLDDSITSKKAFFSLCSLRHATWTDACFVGSEAQHPFWDSVLSKCLMPQTWSVQSSWFAPINTHTAHAQYAVSVIPGLVQETSIDDVFSFIENRGDIAVTGKDEYLAHFRVSRVSEEVGLWERHSGYSTWLDVFEDYPINGELPNKNE